MSSSGSSISNDLDNRSKYFKKYIFNDRSTVEEKDQITIKDIQSSNGIIRAQNIIDFIRKIEGTKNKVSIKSTEKARSLLHYAVSCKDSINAVKDATQCVLRSGVDINHIDENGMNPLMCFIKNFDKQRNSQEDFSNFKEMIKFLIIHGSVLGNDPSNSCSYEIQNVISNQFQQFITDPKSETKHFLNECHYARKKLQAVARNTLDISDAEGVLIYGSKANIVIKDSVKEFRISEFLQGAFCKNNGIAEFSMVHEGKNRVDGFISADGTRHYDFKITDGSDNMMLEWYVEGKKCIAKINVDRNGIELVGEINADQELLKRYGKDGLLNANNKVIINGLSLLEAINQGKNQVHSKEVVKHNEINKEITSESIVRSNGPSLSPSLNSFSSPPSSPTFSRSSRRSRMNRFPNLHNRRQHHFGRGVQGLTGSIEAIDSMGIAKRKEKRSDGHAEKLPPKINNMEKIAPDGLKEQNVPDLLLNSSTEKSFIEDSPIGQIFRKKKDEGQSEAFRQYMQGYEDFIYLGDKLGGVEKLEELELRPKGLELGTKELALDIGVSKDEIPGESNKGSVSVRNEIEEPMENLGSSHYSVEDAHVPEVASVEEDKKYSGPKAESIPKEDNVKDISGDNAELKEQNAQDLFQDFTMEKLRRMDFFRDLFSIKAQEKELGTISEDIEESQLSMKVSECAIPGADNNTGIASIKSEIEELSHHSAEDAHVPEVASVEEDKKYSGPKAESIPKEDNVEEFAAAESKEKNTPIEELNVEDLFRDFMLGIEEQIAVPSKESVKRMGQEPWEEEKSYNAGRDILERWKAKRRAKPSTDGLHDDKNEYTWKKRIEAETNSPEQSRSV